MPNKENSDENNNDQRAIVKAWEEMNRRQRIEAFKNPKNDWDDATKKAISKFWNAVKRVGKDNATTPEVPDYLEGIEDTLSHAMDETMWEKATLEKPVVKPKNNNIASSLSSSYSSDLTRSSYVDDEEVTPQVLEEALEKPVVKPKNTTATKRKTAVTYNRYGRKRFTRVTVAAQAPPVATDSLCRQLFDPIAKTLLSFDKLVERVNHLKEHPAEDGRYFDPCTKRLLPNFESLVTRVQEIRCLSVKKKLQDRDSSSLNLQLHQDIIVTGIQNRIGATKDNRFLIGVLPRGGKTFISGGCIREYMHNKNIETMNVLWMTAAPAETKTQVEKELVGKFSDFKDFDFIDVKNTRDITHRKKHAIFFVSSQLLTLEALGKTSARPFLSQLLTATGNQKISMVFFDEAHKTGSGDSTKKQIDSLIEKYKERTMPFIFLTATYFKVMKDYNIPKENTFLWDYTDVQLTRLLDQNDKTNEVMENLYYRFSKSLVDNVFANRLCTGETLTTMAKSYADYPDLHFLSFDFSEDALEHMRKYAVDEDQKKKKTHKGDYDDEVFNMSHLFKMKPDVKVTEFKTNDNKIRKDAYEAFENIEPLEIMLTYLTPSTQAINANVNVPPVSHAVLQRIDSISKKTGSRFKIDENPSLLMFMPAGRAGTNIFYTLAGWSSLLMKHPWWNQRYEVVCVVEPDNIKEKGLQRQLEGLPNVHVVFKNIKEEIVHLEASASRRNKGLVVLAGEKMSAGISLPFIDVVMLFNDKTAVDDLIQKLYRAVTPSQGKKTAFIVDLNPKRLFTAIFGYTKLSSKPTMTSYDIMKVLLDTYYWDADLIPRDANERLALYTKRDTFQGYIRSLFLGANENENQKKTLDVELQRILNTFEGRPVKSRTKYPVDYSNIKHPENIETLRPMSEQYEKLIKNMGDIDEQLMAIHKKKGKADNNYSSSFDLMKAHDKKRKELNAMIPGFSEKIIELRKRRKEIEAQAAKTTNGTRKKTNKQIALNLKRAEQRATKEAEKLKAKAEAAAVREAAKTKKKANTAAAKEKAKALKLAKKEYDTLLKTYLKEEAKSKKRMANANLADLYARLVNSAQKVRNLGGTFTRKNNTNIRATTPPPRENNNTNTITENNNI